MLGVPRRIYVITTLFLLVIAGLGGWYAPYGAHTGWYKLQAAEPLLMPIGTVEKLERAPIGFGGEQDIAFSIRRDDGVRIVLSGFRYRNLIRRMLRSRAASPNVNSLVWDDPNRSTPSAEAAWQLPDNAKLVGFLCRDELCERWVLWWPRGADITLMIAYSPTRIAPGEASQLLRPVWSVLQ